MEDPTAMVLQAAVEAREGRDQKALEVCEKVINMEVENYAEMPGFDHARARAFDMFAMLKRKNRDTEGSKQALEKAVLEHDEPTAYLQLALYHRQYDSPEYLEFLMKAAASGSLDAASALGRYYIYHAWELQRIAVSQGSQHYSGPKYSIEELYRLSEEWLTVAVDEPGHGDLFTSRSQVDLALLLRKKGEYEKGSELLDKAMLSGDYGRLVGPWVREHWKGTEDWGIMMTGAWKAWDENKESLSNNRSMGDYSATWKYV